MVCQSFIALESRLNGVAKIERNHIHTHIQTYHCRAEVLPKMLSWYLITKTRMIIYVYKKFTH